MLTVHPSSPSLCKRLTVGTCVVLKDGQGTQKAEWNTTLATLGANASTSATPWNFSWVSTQQAVGSYVATLTAAMGGATRTLSSANINLLGAKPAVTLNASQVADPRVLVLASCHQNTGNLTDKPDAACAESRRIFISQMLARLNIPARVVTDAEQFRTELRCGDWNVIWLAGGREKLKDRLPEEIEQQLIIGKGLLVDGVHDERNNGIDELLGVKQKGKLPANQSYSVTPVGSLFTAIGINTYPVEGRATKFDALAGTTVHGTYGTANNANPAIISYNYRGGASMLHAYDLAVTAQSSASLEAIVKTSLMAVAPRILQPNTNAIVQVKVSNTSATAGTVDVLGTLPAGVTLVSSMPTATSVNNGTSPLKWSVTLGAAGSATATSTITVTVKLPNTVPANANTFGISFAVDTTTAATAVSGVTTIQAYTQAAATADTAIAALNALSVNGNDKNARDKAVAFLNTAKTNLANQPETALGAALSAADEVLTLNTPGTLPEQIATIALNAQKGWCTKQAACTLPNFGTGTLKFNNYNVMVFGNANMSNSDSHGAVGIGGAVTLSSFGIASQLTGDAARLNVGGNLTWTTSGSVGSGTGSITTGGTANVSQSVGRKTLTTNTPTEDWLQWKTYYTSMSDKLALLPSIAAVTDTYGKWTLTGTNPATNVFTISGANLDAGHSLVFDVPATSSVIVNVTGTTASFTNGQNYVIVNGQSQGMSDHPFAANVLYNFKDATLVKTSGWSPQGTILAPRAKLEHSNANINGQVFVNELLSTGEYHQCGAYRGNVPVTP